MTAFARARLPHLAPEQWSKLDRFFSRPYARQSVQPHEIALAASMQPDDAIALLQLLAKDHVVTLFVAVYHRDCPEDVPRVAIHYQPFTEGWPEFPILCNECGWEVGEDDAGLELFAKVEGELPSFGVDPSE